MKFSNAGFPLSSVLMTYGTFYPGFGRELQRKFYQKLGQVTNIRSRIELLNLPPHERIMVFNSLVTHEVRLRVEYDATMKLYREWQQEQKDKMRANAVPNNNS